MTARTRRSARLVPAVATLALALVACSDDPEPTPEHTGVPPPVDVGEPSAPGTDEPTTPGDDASTPPADLPTVEETDPAALPPFTAAGTPQTSDPGGEPLLPVDLRVGEHRGYDRVVVELTGDGVPGWRTEYVTEAIEDGRGDRVDVDGDAVLSVHISGTRYPQEGEDHLPGGVIEGPDVVEEVHYLGTFEGLTQLFVGVDDGRADYRVFALADPARVVIDIADPDD